MARIGTSGWHYAHWRGPYYPPSVPPRAMLDYYARDLDTVEINNSFYRLPPSGTFEGWKKSTPPGFCFAVKASRYLTHQKKLLDPSPALKRLLGAAVHLGSKLGPILFQLPPHWRCNIERLSDFLRTLPPSHRYSLECRNATWHTGEVYRLLEQHNVAFCLFELGGCMTPIEVTADFVYVRLHGPGNKYQGDYPTATLKAWCRRIRQWTRCDKDVYVYFDNDQAGYAIKNAKTLRAMVDDS